MNLILLESIRVRNGIPENIFRHQQRVDSSIGGGKLHIADVLHGMHMGITTIEKARFVYDEEGRVLEQSLSPYVPFHPASLQIIECPHIDYSLKYADREALVSARKDCPPQDEVVITVNGFLTDTTYSNIAFWDGSDWITPSHYLLPGTKRDSLLSDGTIKERPLTANDLSSFSHCSLINAMLDLGDVTIPIEKIRI